MIKRFLSIKINTISSAAILVAFSSLFSRLLGVVRDRILAGTFGAGDSLDIYYAAFRVPDLIFNLVILGALSAGFIPVLSKLLDKDKDNHNEAWELTSNVINILGLSMLCVSVLMMILASPLASLVSPGFSPEKQAAVAVLTRIMFLSPLLLGLSSIVGGVLQSFRSFVAYSLAPILYNFGIIFGALVLVPAFGLKGLAFGVVLGALMHLAIQLPSLFHLGFRYQSILDFKNQQIRTIAKMMVPRTMSLAISQLDMLVSTAIASTLLVGSLAVYNFANNLQFFPIGIFGISFATAAFPVFARVAKDKDKLIEHFSSVVRQVLYFIVPVSVFMFLLREQIVGLILASGSFTNEALTVTADLLGVFMFSVFAQALIPVLVRVYYARENSRTPFYIGLFTVILDIVLALYFSKSFGVLGIAAAFSISSIINFLLLWLNLRLVLGNLGEAIIFRSLIKSIIASIVAGSGVYLIVVALSSYSYLTSGFLAGLFGFVTYVALTWTMRSPEAIGLIEKMSVKIKSNLPEVIDQGEARGL